MATLMTPCPIPSTKPTVAELTKTTPHANRITFILHQGIANKVQAAFKTRQIVLNGKRWLRNGSTIKTATMIKLLGTIRRHIRVLFYPPRILVLVKDSGNRYGAEDIGGGSRVSEWSQLGTRSKGTQDKKDEYAEEDAASQ